MSHWDGGLMDTGELEVLAGRREFPMAQRLLSAPTNRRLGGTTDIDWYDTDVHPEAGAFALVRSGAGLDDLIGEILKLTLGQRTVFVFVLIDADVSSDIAISRRAYLSVSPLSMTPRAMIVEVVGT